MTPTQKSPNQAQPGTQSGNDWNRDQDGQVRHREAGTNQTPTGLPDGTPIQHGEHGHGTTMKGAGSAGTTRY